jgi:Uncharacterized metal-binding protein
MNKENPFCLKACGQIQGLLKGVESGSGDVLGRVPETMFQPLLKYPRLDDQQIGFLNLYDQKPIYLTQRDVRELQLAKAAVAAGTEILMDEMGIKTEDIQRVCLAGALANYVNPLSALRIGLIPMVDPEIVTLLGNASSTGGYMVLMSKNYWQLANDLSESIEYVELSSRLDFNECFVDQMNFPTENVW